MRKGPGGGDARGLPPNKPTSGRSSSALSLIACMDVPLFLYLHSKYSRCLLPHTLAVLVRFLSLAACLLRSPVSQTLLSNITSTHTACRTTINPSMTGPAARRVSRGNHLRSRHISNSSNGVSSPRNSSISRHLATTLAHTAQCLVAMVRVLRYGMQTAYGIPHVALTQM